jgi:hypothetical protein
MRCPDIAGMVVPPRSSHALWILMVGNDIVVVRELFVADCTFPVLFDDLPVQESPHFCWRPEFAISSGMVRIVNALNTQPHSTFLPNLFPAAAKHRSVNWTELIATEFH